MGEPCPNRQVRNSENCRPKYKKQKGEVAMETEVIVKARILRLPRGTLLNKEAIAQLLDVSSRTI